MGHAKIDHAILTDPETFDLPANAGWLFVKLIVWSSREETDGRVPLKVAKTLGSTAGRSELIRRSLVVQVDGHLVVKNYLKYQTSKTAIQAKRAAAAEKKRRQRAACPGGTSGIPSTENRVQSTENKEQRVVTPKPPRKAKPRAASWKIVPDSWEPNDSHRAKARDLNLNFEEELSKFRNYEFTRAYTDADRCFHKWLQRAAEMRNEAADRAPPPGYRQHQARQAESVPAPYHRPFANTFKAMP